MEDRTDKARELFLSGCSCAQAVLAAYADDIGLSKETALKLASSFGGGMGGLREVCGALTALFMLAGARSGYCDTTDPERKSGHYALIRSLADEFKAANGSIICRELLSALEALPGAEPSARTAEYYKERPCLRFVECAAALAAKKL